MTDIKELEIAIVRVGISKREIARELGISESTLYNKLSNKAEFKASEIVKMCDILKLNSKQREQIFLTCK